MKDFILGIFPVILFFSLIVVFKRSTLLSAYLSLLSAVILNFVNPSWQMSLPGVFLAILEGFCTAFWPIGGIVLAALFCYSLMLETGQINIIKKILEGISSDKRVQVLLIAWGFGSFMEGVAGYGTSVAIPAGILLVLGFGPLYSALICLISIGGSNSFGSVGIPVIMLANQVNLDSREMGANVLIQLLPFIIIIPILLVILANRGRSKKIKDAFSGKILIVLLACMAAYVPSIFIALYMGPEMPAIIGGIFIMTTIIVLSKTLLKEKKVVNTDVDINEENKATKAEIQEKVNVKTMLKAFLSYILMVLFLLIVNPINKGFYNFFYSKTTLNINFSRDRYYNIGNGEITSFKLLLAPVFPIFLATLSGGLLQGAKIPLMKKTFLWVLKNNRKTILTMMGIVSFASFMKHSGIIMSVAGGVTNITGSFYPLIAPFIGAIGTFMTGSNTSANLLFGALQNVAAENLNINRYWLTASNSTGATLGTMISLQSLSIVAATVGITGRENIVLKKTVKYSVALLIILSIYIYLGSIIIPT